MNESVKNPDVAAPIGTGSSAFESAVAANSLTSKQSAKNVPKSSPNAPDNSSKSSKRRERKFNQKTFSAFYNYLPKSSHL